MPQCPPGTISYTVRAGDTVYQIALRYRTTVDAVADLNPGLNVDKISIGQVLCVRPDFGNPLASAQATVSKARLDLSNQLRMLWEQHVAWTRLAILSMVFDLPDAELVTNRLLRNPKDFGDALRPIFGETVASKFSDLLTEHLKIAAELVKAAKANNSATAADAEKRWYANADEIAAFLARINPYWSEREWKSLLYDHLAMTKREAVDMLTKNFADGISTYDNIEKEALHMADVMTNGIARGAARGRA